MAIQAFAELNCSIARPLSFLGERWALLVLRDLFLGRRRFDEIQDSLGVASNVLSQRLATLTEEGIVERRRYSEHPERFEYRLTEKGRDLQPVLLALLAWGDRYTAGPEGPPLETVHAECGHAFHMVPTCSECGERGRPEQRPSRPGPGANEEQRRARRAHAACGGAGADRRLRLPRARARRASCSTEGWAVRGTSRARGGPGGDRGGRDRAGAAPIPSGPARSSTWSATSPSSSGCWARRRATGEELAAIHGAAARAPARTTRRHPGAGLRLRGGRGGRRGPARGRRGDRPRRPRATWRIPVAIARRPTEDPAGLGRGSWRQTLGLLRPARRSI